MALAPPDWGGIDESAQRRTIRLNSVPHDFTEENLMASFGRLLPDLADRPIFEYRHHGESNIVYVTFKHWAHALHIYQSFLQGRPEVGGWANFVPMEADLHTSDMTICISGIPKRATELDIISYLKNFSEDVPSVELKCRGDLTLEAFVTFSNVSSVERLTASQGVYLLGAYASVSRANLFKISPGYPLPGAIQSVRTVIMSDLSTATTKETIMEKFGDQAVHIEFAWLELTQMAYVTFTSPAAVVVALSLDESLFEGTHISVKRAYFCPLQEPSYVSENTVMVQRLSPSLDEEILCFDGISTDDLLTFFQTMHLNEVPYMEMHRDAIGNEVAYATFNSKAVADQVKAHPMGHVAVGLAVLIKNSLYFDPPGGEVTDVPYFGVNDEVDPDDTFPVKLYKVLGMERYNEIVVWVPGGDNLIQIRDLATFKADVLPNQFNMTYAAFKRRLKDYGFEECSEKWTWHHPTFKNGAAAYAANMVVLPKKTLVGEVAGLANQVREYGKTMTGMLEQMRALGPKVDGVIEGLHGCQARLTNMEEKLSDLTQGHM